MNSLIAMTSAAVVAASMLGPAGAASAQTHPFSFRSVEFMPRDQREPSARAFIDEYAAPGMSLSAATGVMKAAGASCRMRRDGQGVVLCTASSFQHHPGDDLTDIQWRVRLYPNADDTINHASITRSQIGV